MEKKEIKWKGVAYPYFHVHSYSGEPLPAINFNVALPIIIGGATNRGIATAPSNSIIIGVRLHPEDKHKLALLTQRNKLLLDVLGQPYEG